MEKKKLETVSALPSAAALRASKAAVSAGDARVMIESLFDSDTFIETASYTKRAFSEFGTAAEEFEGVITGYGAIDGELVFAFVQTPARKFGAVDARHSKKICDLYSLAAKNGAPVVGVFSSAGGDIFEGVETLAAYGRIMKAVSDASGVIPQIAVINGLCTGSSPQSLPCSILLWLRRGPLFMLLRPLWLKILLRAILSPTAQPTLQMPRRSCASSSPYSPKTPKTEFLLVRAPTTANGPWRH